jgi:hypothetical protein
MTDDNAAWVADLIIAAAVVGAAYYVVKTPPLRRLAWRLGVAALTGTIPAWLGHEIRRAWVESGGRDTRDIMSA